MTRMKFFLEKWGLHPFLLVIFFGVHNYQQYYGLVSVAVALKLTLVILLIFSLFFLIILALTKHVNRSLQLMTLFGFIELFFGVIKDFLQTSLHANFISRYVVLLPLLIICTFYIAWVILKKKDFRKNNLFQNTLLLLFLFIEVIKLIGSDSSLFLHKNLLVKNNFSMLGETPSTDKKPDIYYLLLDSYPGTTFLNEFMNYDNSLFNQKLEEKGFFVVKKPRSNYNRTPFSIASTLNFEYLSKFRTNTRVSSKDYAEANLTVKNAIVPQFFIDHNYSFYNLSIFDIGTTRAIKKETFLTMPEQSILLYNTLPGRIKNDILWNIVAGKFAIPLAQKLLVQTKEAFQKEQEQKNVVNGIVIDSLMKIPFQKTNSPKFVYAHFYLPHPPFFYDENGKKNDIEYVITEASLKNKDLFLSYLKYTNKIVVEMIDRIQNSSGNKPVILVQSDHGFRDFTGGPTHPECFFTNYSAFYFPDKDYSGLYDTLSNVNTFPIIFNKYFKTKIPLQKDTSVFLFN